jgi:hypothetical protein
MAHYEKIYKLRIENRTRPKDSYIGVNDVVTCAYKGSSLRQCSYITMETIERNLFVCTYIGSPKHPFALRAKLDNNSRMGS